jgi:hypothetical protein
MSCVFCGATKTTREHAWPEWVRDEFQRPKLLNQRARGSSIDDRAFSAPPFTAIVNRVCAACNNGWMSDLETRAKPLLKPVFQGRGREIHKEGQRMLAAWAFKTAVMLEYTHPDARTITKAERTALYERHEAPSDCQIWIGAYNGTDLNTYYKNDRLESDSGDEHYAITFLMGSVVFQLWGLRDSGRPHEIKGPLGRRLLQISPYRASVTVRPQLALEDRFLRQATLSLVKPGRPRQRFRLRRIGGAGPGMP